MWLAGLIALAIILFIFRPNDDDEGSEDNPNKEKK